MLTAWQAIVLGLVEGITEYLPVSSTGHLIMAASLLGLERPETKEALDAYLVVIQGGAILAVLILYWPRVVQMLRGCLGRDRDGALLARNVLLAFLPALVVAPVLSATIKRTLFSDWPVLAALFVGGMWMIWLGRRPDHGTADVATMSWRTALGVGLFQLLALWPGTSRSMVTIGGGTLLGLGGPAAAEFSFLVGLPTLGAACVHDLARAPSMFAALGVGPALLGIAVATVSAAIAVRWLVSFLGRHGLAPFGWYRLAISLLFAGLIVAGVVRVG